MPTAKLCVNGMRNAADERRVEAALRAVAGVFGAQASREAACAEVDFEDDDADVQRLVAAVVEEGFDARLAG